MSGVSAINWPLTSSMTTTLGSFVSVISIARPAAHTPIAYNAMLITANDSRAQMGVSLSVLFTMALMIRKSITPSAAPNVPGATGAEPAPAPVAII